MKAVLFDLDGVVVSTDIYHYEAWKAIADAEGLKFNFEINHKLRGVSRAESLQIILDVNGKKVSQQDFNRLMTEKNDRYRKLLEKITPEDMLPGVMNLLISLKQNGVKVGIGSSSRNTPKILERLGLADYFDIVVDGNSITHSKPHPEVFIFGAQGLAQKAENCVVIEDAPAGIKAALAAHMVAVGVGDEDLEGAHVMFGNLSGVDYAALLKVYKAQTN